MDWYYVDGGKQAGPVNDTEFEQLVIAGKVQASTLVWHEGMAEWLMYGQVNPARAATLTAEPPPPAIGSLPAQSTPLTGNEVVCVQCNRMFPKEETIQYGTAYVCATCKPTFVQKLKEGAVTPTYLGAMDYAGFWIRFGAKFIDNLAIMVVVGVPLVIFMIPTMRSAGPVGGRPPGFMVGFQVLFQLFFFVVIVAYNTLMQGKYGATLGKLACGLKVVQPDGAPISYGRAFGRAWAELLSGPFTCDIGYVIAAFDDQKRSLHDHIANTRVVRVR